MTMPASPATLTSRREFAFCYDIKMGNPNGDPDENRPRVLPDKTHYVTDVRLKRFARDFFKLQDRPILVDKIEGQTTNLTGRVAAHLQATGKKEANGAELVNILLDAFIDARLFGSSFAFKEQEGFKLAAEPKTLTGAVQIMHGEVLHKAQEVDISGTSIFGSDKEKAQGTFTTYYGLRYALIGFNGIANEHSAKVSHMTDADYAHLLRAMWDGVRAAANTRTKRGQVPRLLLGVVYKPGSEFQFGNLIDYLKLTARADKEGHVKQQHEWSSPDDYTIDVSRLLERLGQQAKRIAKLEVCLSPDVTLSAPLAVPGVERIDLNFDAPSAG
jgi:CRISPR-associated protein Csh2